MAKLVGVLFGQENSFPPALVDRINAAGAPDVAAERARVDGVRMDEPSRYAVIVDRISHDVPFYRAYLKNAVLGGAAVINNPFWWSADDKFFNYAMAARMGVAIPRTVLLPHKEHPPNTTAQSMRNLNYPLDWEGIFAYVGFPAFLKPFDGGGWRDVYKVHNPAEVFAAYDQTGTLCMTLQRGVNFDEYFRCYVIGQRDVRIMPYDPRRPFHERYLKDPPAYDPRLIERVERDAIAVCRALGYDFNTVEFAVEDGVPYAIDFMNPAPDADLFSVGPESFEWVVSKVAALAIEKALAPREPVEYRWASFLNPSTSS
ncbi:MAG: hypothetical protein WD690_11935 [Vicinamibacterales bacterium]